MCHTKISTSTEAVSVIDTLESLTQGRLRLKNICGEL